MCVKKAFVDSILLSVLCFPVFYSAQDESAGVSERKKKNFFGKDMEL